MKKTTTILLIASALAFTACSDSKKEETPAKLTINPVEKQEVKKIYTIDEIYNSMCIQCHSSDGSGNTERLTPTMVGQSEEDMRNSLVDVENDDGHVIMEHNRAQILKKGMNYTAPEMAKYMYERFNK